MQASTSLSVQTWSLRALSPLTMRRMHCPSPRLPSPRLLTAQADTPGTSRWTTDLAYSKCSGPARCRCRMLANATPTRPAGRGQSGPADTCVPALSQVHDGYPTGRIMDSKTYREGYVLRYDSQTRQPKANYYDAIPQTWEKLSDSTYRLGFQHSMPDNAVGDFVVVRSRPVHADAPYRRF